jgi:DNA invertase Pin-like site-specific DNA recombinase
MMVGYMRVSSESDRQITDLQRDALLAAGVDGRLWSAKNEND